MMKKLILYVFIGLTFGACGGSSGGEEPPPPPPVNRAPTTPQLSTPADELLCVDSTVSFSWSSSSDPDGDSILYTIEIASDNSFSNIVQTQSLSATSTSLAVNDNEAFYWRVKASDAQSLSSGFSSTFKFYTYGIGVTNHLPFAPELVAPLNNAVVLPSATDTATLKWTASDVDTSDTLSYDVYFGSSSTLNTPSNSNVSATELEVNVSASTTYFWKIVVKDNEGGETIGQVWSFTTD